MNYFLKDMGERAIKTFFETAIATLGVVLVIDEMPWVIVLIVSLSSALLSMFTSACTKYITGKDSASLIKMEETK